MNKETAPVYFLSKNPPGWKEASLTETQHSLQAVTHRINNRLISGEKVCQRDIAVIAKEEQNDKWERTTGIKAKDSHFSIIMPIHNEKNFLESTLGTLALADIPSEADVVIILVTNGCTDGGASEQIVRNFMQTQGAVQERISREGILPEDISDKQVDQNYAVTESDNMRFIHINTPTPGKTNALTIGNDVANYYNHPISMCLDANSFPTPKAIAELYKEAYKGIVEEEDGTAVVSGRYKDHTETEEIIMGMTPRELLPSYTNKSNLVVIGALMAWDTKWVKDVGIPHVVLDDFALGVNAIVDGKQVKTATEAYTWRYSPATVEARAKQLERYVWGVHQIADLSKEHSETILPAVFFMQGPEILEQSLNDWAGNNEKRVNALPFIMKKWEVILENGKQQFISQPNSQTWEDIEGTK